MRKQHILYIVTIISILFIYTNNVSALSYESNIGVGFTFNPTLSINISSSDLVISNLTPGTTENSNDITISVATNAAYGYTLSATTNSNSLVHDDNNINSVFSSIATNADLASLTSDNTWGYTSKLGNEIAWNNYNGLSSSSSTVLLDSNNKSGNVEGNNSNNDNNGSNNSIDFKISAKASSTQPSGVYTGTINFIAVSKVAPMSLLDSFIASGATMHHGYYTMQDMTSTICNKVEAIGSQLQVLDIRDYKLYWIAKLADNHCWMTQNLNLDLDSNRTYTHWDTDLGWSTDNGNTVDEDATWKPSSPTINFDGATTNQVAGWINSNTEPYSANPGDIYYYTSGTEDNDIKYNSLQECIVAGHNDCPHYHAGNYYNWSAAVGSNNTGGITSGSAPNSACAKGWKLPTSLYDALHQSGIISGVNSYLANGFNNVRIKPLYFGCFGNVSPGGVFNDIGYEGRYWYSRSSDLNYSRSLIFGATRILTSDNNTRAGGYSIRCLAR